MEQTKTDYYKSSKVQVFATTDENRNVILEHFPSSEFRVLTSKESFPWLQYSWVLIDYDKKEIQFEDGVTPGIKCLPDNLDYTQGCSQLKSKEIFDKWQSGFKHD